MRKDSQASSKAYKSESWLAAATKPRGTESCRFALRLGPGTLAGDVSMGRCCQPRGGHVVCPPLLLCDDKDELMTAHALGAKATRITSSSLRSSHALQILLRVKGGERSAS